MGCFNAFQLCRESPTHIGQDRGSWTGIKSVKDAISKETHSWSYSLGFCSWYPVERSTSGLCPRSQSPPDLAAYHRESVISDKIVGHFDIPLLKHPNALKCLRCSSPTYVWLIKIKMSEPHHRRTMLVKNMRKHSLSRCHKWTRLSECYLKIFSSLTVAVTTSVRKAYSAPRPQKDNLVKPQIRISIRKSPADATPMCIEVWTPRWVRRRTIYACS